MLWLGCGRLAKGREGVGVGGGKGRSTGDVCGDWAWLMMLWRRRCGGEEAVVEACGGHTRRTSQLWWLGVPAVAVVVGGCCDAVVVKWRGLRRFAVERDRGLGVEDVVVE